MNCEKLYSEMRKADVKVGEMCAKLGMSRTAFYRKTRGISEFTLSEIEKICDVLDLSSPQDIFFSRKVS